MCAPRSSDYTTGGSQPCGDANHLAEDQTHGYNSYICTNHLSLKTCNKEVQFVYSFTYLGSLITNDGSSSRDIISRIAKAASAMYRRSNALFRKHRINVRAKINVYHDLVVSVLPYGSESWSTTLGDRRRLYVFDMRCQMRLLCVFWQQHISNQSIRELTKEPTASSPTTTLPTLVRTSPPHAILLPCTKGLRLQPNNSWLEKTKRSPQNEMCGSHQAPPQFCDTTNAAKMVFDRLQWKAFVSGLPTLEPEPQDSKINVHRIRPVHTLYQD